MSVILFRVTVAAVGSVISGLLLVPMAVGQETAATARESTEVESVDLEVLMRGPVHEGFAEPSVSVTAETRETMQLTEPPPDPIDEQPAIVRPVDANRDAIWLPGYWGVEAEDQLVWVCGTWRYSPPGMRWVPGYWAETGGDSVWVPGFWIEETVEQITYLPPPPEPQVVEPPPAPGDDYFWVPGRYEWRDGDYLWISGFWAQANPSWVWVPARYVATPRGYVYVDGYWDFPPERRGTLFAPVRFATVRTNYRYRPTVAINVAHALVHWFVRPSYGHYYFGNYYGNEYRDFGLRPWAAYVDDRDYYDPLYTYYSVARTDYLQTLVTTRQRITAQGDIGLPVSYREYQQVVAQGSAPAGIADLAVSVDQLVESSEGRFENLQDATDAASTERLREDVGSFRRFVQGRRQVELDGQSERRRQGDQDPRTVDRPDADRPRTEQLDADQPRTERPDTDQPKTERPDSERPRTERPDSERPRTERPDSERPRTERPSIEQRVRDAQERAARQRASQDRDRDNPAESLRDRAGQADPFDIRPFSRGRTEARPDRQPAGQADARAESRADIERGGAEAAARGEAGVRGQRRPGGDEFTPPPRLRNPAAQGRGGATPGVRGAAEAAREAAEGQNRVSPGNRGERGLRPGQGNRSAPGSPGGQGDRGGQASPGAQENPDAQGNPGGGATRRPDEAPE